MMFCASLAALAQGRATNPQHKVVAAKM